MPIKPENKALYPWDWPTISRAAKEAAGWKCQHPGCSCQQYDVGYWHGEEWMISGRFPYVFEGAFSRARQYAAEQQFAHTGDVPDPDPRYIVIVLTTAHVGLPAHLPVHLHVAAMTETDEVAQVVGFLVPFQAEEDEWAHMMYRRALAQFERGPSAQEAGFFVTLPGGSTGGIPGGPVATSSAPVAPQGARLTDWRLLREPHEAARIAAESAAGAQMPSADVKRLSAAFADALAEPAFRQAHGFVGTVRRTGLLSLAGLGWGHGKKRAADDALAARFAAAHSASYARTLRATPDGCGIFSRAFIRAALPWPPRIMGEAAAAGGARDAGGGFSWACHDSMLLHVAEYPENCDAHNLAVYCQRHHLRYDAKHHAETAYMTRRAKRNNLELDL